MCFNVIEFTYVKNKDNSFYKELKSKLTSLDVQ